MRRTVRRPAADVPGVDVCLDLDGVVCDLVAGALARVNGTLGTSLVPADVTRYSFADCLPPAAATALAGCVHDRVLLAALVPHLEAVAVLPRLRALARRVVVATDRPSELHDVTLSWLLRQGIEDFDELVVGAGAKAEVARAATLEERPLVIVDDNPDCALLASPWVEVRLPARPWNAAAAAGLRFHDWQDVVACVERLAAAPADGRGRAG